MNTSRFLPLIVPGVVFIMFEIVFFFSQSLYIIAFLMFLFLAISARKILQKSTTKEKWLNIILLPLYLCFSAILLSIMLPIKILAGQLIVQFLYTMVSLLIYFYYRLIYDFLINKSKFKANSLSYFSSYANFISIYLISSAAFGLQSFLSISIWIIVLIILIVTLATSYEVMWANEIKGPLSFFYISLICLVIFELTWAVSFLTLSYYILGLLIAIAYYVIIGLVRFQLLKSLNINIVKTYLTLGLVSLVVVLMTARWI